MRNGASYIYYFSYFSSSVPNRNRVDSFFSFFITVPFQKCLHEIDARHQRIKEPLQRQGLHPPFKIERWMYCMSFSTNCQQVISTFSQQGLGMRENLSLIHLQPLFNKPSDKITLLFSIKHAPCQPAPRFSRSSTRLFARNLAHAHSGIRS